MAMKFATSLAALVLLVAPLAPAKDPPSYDKGMLLSMESTNCGASMKDSKSLTGELLGTDTNQKNVHEVLCQEYVMQSERITYRLRPKEEKHPAILPVGEGVEFRIRKDKMYMRVLEGDQKEREYQVVSMKLREDAKDAHAPNAANK
jgi:hypothetical protein